MCLKQPPPPRTLLFWGWARLARDSSYTSCFQNSHQNSWGKGSNEPSLVTLPGACHGGSETLNSFPPGISPTSSRFIDGLVASGGTIPVSSCALSTHETGCPDGRLIVSTSSLVRGSNNLSLYSGPSSS